MAITIHDARASEKTVLDLPPTVPSQRTIRTTSNCSKSECQTARRKTTRANWRAKTPEYSAGYRIQWGERRIDRRNPCVCRRP